MFEYTVKSKCTALLNRKHRRFIRIQALASACALHLTTYYHVPEISDSVLEVRKLIWKHEHSLKKRLSIEFRWKLELFQKYGIRVRNHGMGRVDNENENQSQYSNMSNTYIGRSLIY